MLFGALWSVNSVKIKFSLIYFILNYLLSLNWQTKKNLNFIEKDRILMLHFLKVNIFVFFRKKFHFFTKTLVGFRQCSDSFPDGRKVNQKLQVE